MKWIKAHLTIVISGAVSLVAVALIALGILTSTVKESLARDSSIVQSLNLASPVNERIIEEQEKLLKRNTQQLEQTQKRLEERGGYQPLHPDVFPDINPANPGARFRFKPLLLEAQRKMVADLNAKTAPTPEEQALEATEMAIQKAREATAESLGVGGAKPPTGASRFQPPMGTGLAGKLTVTPSGDSRKGITPEQLAKDFPDVRLAIRRAREIYCYVGHEAQTFGQWPLVTASTYPEVAEMWYAQMALWIQQDVVKALAGLNNRVADAVKARQQRPWVGLLPVKHLQRIAIQGYAFATATGSDATAGAPTQLGEAMPVGGATPSFTKQQCSPAVDVIHFSVDLVVEARMLPQVIDEICKAGFYTPSLVNYSLQPFDPNWNGYIYGSVPAIQVSLDFEGNFVRAKYEKWMPEAVKTAITAGTAKFEQGLLSASPSAAPSMRTPAPTFGPNNPLGLE